MFAAFAMLLLLLVATPGPTETLQLDHAHVLKQRVVTNLASHRRRRRRSRLGAGVASAPKPDTLELCSQTTYNNTAKLDCPRNMAIESFPFASFGTPEGGNECSAYRLGPCHVGHTRTILQNMCAGKGSCSVPVTNQFFGVASMDVHGLDAQVGSVCAISCLCGEL